MSQSSKTTKNGPKTCKKGVKINKKYTFLRIFCVESNETSYISCKSKKTLKLYYVYDIEATDICFKEIIMRKRQKKQTKLKNYAKSLNFEIPFILGSIISRSDRHHLYSIADAPQIRFKG